MPQVGIGNAIRVAMPNDGFTLNSDSDCSVFGSQSRLYNASLYPPESCRVSSMNRLGYQITTYNSQLTIGGKADLRALRGPSRLIRS